MQHAVSTIAKLINVQLKACKQININCDDIELMTCAFFTENSSPVPSSIAVASICCVVGCLAEVGRGEGEAFLALVAQAVPRYVAVAAVRGARAVSSRRGCLSV
jgi:hypothetical protein